MSETSKNLPAVIPIGERSKGNKFASLTYDEKLIRDELKGNIYRAVRGLNMTEKDAEDYYNRPGVTVMEKLFYDAAVRKNWNVLERFFDRVIGVSAIKQTADVDLGAHEKRDLSKLNEADLEQLRLIHSKLNSSKP